MRKIYKYSKNNKIRYVIYSSLSSIRKSLSTLDFNVIRLENIHESGGYIWKAVDCDLTPPQFIDKLDKGELIQYRSGDVLRKKRANIRKDLIPFIKKLNNKSSSSYLTILENHSREKRLVAEEIGKLIEKNKWWDKLYIFESVLKDIKNNTGAVSYSYSPETAFSSWNVESKVTMQKESWNQYNVFKELVE